MINVIGVTDFDATVVTFTFLSVILLLNIGVVVQTSSVTLASATIAPLCSCANRVFLAPRATKFDYAPPIVFAPDAKIFSYASRIFFAVNSRIFGPAFPVLLVVLAIIFGSAIFVGFPLNTNLLLVSVIPSPIDFHVVTLVHLMPNFADIR